MTPIQPAQVVLIAAADSPLRIQISTLSRAKIQYDLQIFEPDRNLEENLRSSKGRVVIFDCERMDKYELAVLRLISQVKPDVNLIVLADQIAIFSYRQIDLVKNVITLQKPLQPFLFLSVLERAVNEEPLVATRSTRFVIDEAVNVMNEKTGIMLPTRMRNYSASGAFLEYRGISLKIGDRIQMNLERKEESGDRMSMKAKVVWIRDGDHPRSASRGIGVQFLEESW